MQLARDNSGAPIQALRPINGTGQVITTSTSVSARSAKLSNSPSAVRLVASTDTYVALGGSTVTAHAACMFLPAGAVEYVAISASSGVTHVAGLAVSAIGSLYVIEVE